MKRNKKRNRIYLLVLLLLGITVGFAALATTLKINGNASITKNNWSVYWDEDSIAVTQGSKGDTTPTVENGEDGSVNTKVNWNVNLEVPGDFYEFTIDAANAGTIDAMITGITPTLPQNLPSYVSYSVTYADGVEPAQYHLLPKGTKSGSTITPTTEKYKVRIEFLNTITPEQMDAIPEGGLSLDFGYEVQYGQADDNAVEKPSWFANASWNDIIANYNNGNPTQLLQNAMINGKTKEVELDLDNDGTAETTGHLRIANLSTPSECETEGFSQTACGLVLEFVDVITTHRMNPYTDGTTDGDGSKGGWKYSDMRSFLNGTVYAYENIDYTGQGIIDSLPSELRSKIIDTTVVSGHGLNDTNNFTTSDKIYLLSTKEVWGKEGTSNVMTQDTAEAETRQLDYYKAKGVTTSNKSGAIKKRINNGNAYYWWLRSARSNGSYVFLGVRNNGTWGSSNSHIDYGVAPAFRIAE